MFEKNTKALNLTVVSLFVAFFLGGAILNLFWPDRDFSEAENRYLASMPKLTWDSVKSGEFGQKFETYITDQFLLRDFWVQVKSESELLLQKKENNGVYFGKNHVLIERFDQPDMTKSLRHVEYIKEFSQRLKIPVKVALLPTAAEIMTENLPFLAAPYSQEEYLNELLNAAIDSKAQWLDTEVWAALKEHKEEYLYFNSDHHWTALGAFRFYQSLMPFLGFEPISEQAYNKNIVAHGFYGTLSAKVPGYGKEDTIEQWLLKDTIPSYTVEIPDSNYLGDSFFFPQRLEEKDRYTYYLDGNHALTIIRNINNPEGKKLLLVKDSYAHVLAPFLAPHYKEIQLLDLRYYNTPIDELITEENFDEVLVLYSTRQFAVDSHIFKLSD